MIRFLKLMIRNILKFRMYSALNIVGLSIGLVSVLFIFMWIFNESNYDKFNTNYSNIYQINFKTKEGDRWDGSPAPLAPAIADRVPEVQATARIRRCLAFAFSSGEKMFYEENGITSDPGIFDIFSFNVLEGNPKEALNSVETMVVTKSFARKYFGNKDPLNRQLKIEGKGYLTIKAVIEDVPVQSHIQFDYILSHKFGEAYRLCGMEWGDPNFITYILVQPNADISKVLASVTQVAMDNKLPHIFYGGNVFNLRPLKDIYLDYAVPNQLGEIGDSRKVTIFGSIGILILLLACINYINLSVSLFSRRQKNTSIRKICGAQRKEIFVQNFSESLVVILISLLIAIAIVVLLKPVFISLIGKGIGTTLPEPRIVLFIIALFIATVFLCGIYPSFILSGRGSTTLFEKLNNRNSKNRGLKFMVGFQNAISVLLIICTIGIFKQMNYIRQKDLGFQPEQIAYISLRGNISSNINAVKERLSGYAGIKQIAFKDCLPFGIINKTSGIVWKVNDEVRNTGSENNFFSETTRIDPEYFDLMGVKIVQGRNFEKDVESDKQNYILNEEAVHRMDLTDPIGTEIALYGQWGRVVGVIKNTYFKSLHEAIGPQVYHQYKDLDKESYFGIMYLKLASDNIRGSLAELENIWKEYNPDIPFEYHFLNSEYESLYRADRRMAGMINVFSLLAVFIGCLGLFGQSTLAAENRVKEVGIRKVNGANILEVIVLLNKNFLGWIIIAFAIASPFAWYAMRKWLENFAYKTNLSWWIFALAGVLTLGIALLTVSWQSWRAATRNPVEALRYE